MHRTGIPDEALSCGAGARALSPAFDPWEPATGRSIPDRARLTSIEVTVTNLCNLRCVHCAVGEALVARAETRVPVAAITAALDRIATLSTLSITGGEPSYSSELVRGFVLPLLRYARGRGLRTQLNTNLTMPLERYLPLAEYVDVWHTSWNYTAHADFHRVAFGHRPAPPPAGTEILFARILANASALATAGGFVSAETMMTPETLPLLSGFNRVLAVAGCRRHEVHPRYPVDWASELAVPGLDHLRAGIHRFLDDRDPDLWLLFGTFPFFACSPDRRDRELVRRVRNCPGVTIRNDPDGRSRLNLNGLTGDVFVTDFADLPPLGNIDTSDLSDLFAAWQGHPAAARFACCCPAASCLGPNPIVAATYYPEVDFRRRRAILGHGG